MKKLSKKEIAERDAITAKLGESAESVNELVGKINDAIGEYNAILAEAKEWAEGIASNIESSMDNKSDAWREGDTGQAVEAWKDEFSNLEIEDLEEIEITVDHVETINTLPEQAEV